MEATFAMLAMLLGGSGDQWWAWM